MSNKAVMYDSALYTPNNGDTVAYDAITDKFVPVAPSGGGVNMISITHSALVALIGASNLVPGAFYQITDFQTSHYIQFSGPVTGSGGIGGEEVNLGPIEPLVVQAISYSELSINASSTTYPNDKILYLLSVPDGDYDYAASTGKGCIIYRENILRKVARDYDWRSVVFRRWETSPGSGDYYSCIPVIGSAYQDVPAFAYPDTYYNAYVRSPLDNPIISAVYTGADYWLDNTVIDLDTVSGLFINTGYLNHFTGYAGISSQGYMHETYFNICSNNIVAVNGLTLNKIDVFSDNNYIQNFIATFFGGSATFGFNNISVVANNDLTGYVYGNDAISIINNINLVYLTLNKAIAIENNDVPYISDNTVSSISNNICDDIHSNSVTYLNYNDCKTIQRNVSRDLSYNVMAGDIEENTVENITYNTCASIFENVGQGIFGNSAPVQFIYNNMFNYISSNTNNGNISYNNVNYIYQNLNGNDIQYNTCAAIYANSANVSKITFNTSSIISGNTNTGEISSNNIAFIISNSNLGHISANVGYRVLYNSTDDAIINNNVHSIQSSSGTGLIASNQGHLLYGNTFVDDFTYNKFHTFQGNTFGNSAGANKISNHNFIDSVYSKIVYPTVSMSSSAIPTKTMYDVGPGQHSEVTLTAGVLSYLTVTA